MATRGIWDLRGFGDDLDDNVILSRELSLEKFKPLIIVSRCGSILSLWNGWKQKNKCHWVKSYDKILIILSLAWPFDDLFSREVETIIIRRLHYKVPFGEKNWHSSFFLNFFESNSHIREDKSQQQLKKLFLLVLVFMQRRSLVLLFF